MFDAQRTALFVCQHGPGRSRRAPAWCDAVRWDLDSGEVGAPLATVIRLRIAAPTERAPHPAAGAMR